MCIERLCKINSVILSFQALLSLSIKLQIYSCYNRSYLTRKAHQGAKASWGLEVQGTLEARAFLSEVHHMSNMYFMIFMMVVSYFYMTFSQFLGYFS